jgi:cytochrome P450
VRAHAAFKKRGGELLKPILDAQMANEKHLKIISDESDDVQGTFLQWLLARTPESRRHDEFRLSQNQMDCMSSSAISPSPALTDYIVVSFAAIHTTSMATTAVIYDLAAYPEYIPALREELQKVIDEDGYDLDGDGYKKLKKSSIPRLWKLDSFLKESQRLTPPSLGKTYFSSSVFSFSF